LTIRDRLTRASPAAFGDLKAGELRLRGVLAPMPTGLPGQPWPKIARIATATITGAVLVVCVVVLAQELAVMSGTRALREIPGLDYSLYMEATRRWLGGGPFYEPYQLAGPYAVGFGDILYPPQMLALFVPFTVLPWPLWYAIPAAITVGSIVAWRPAAWSWVAILLVATVWMWTFLVWCFGTPTIWFIALVALGLRHAPTAALILLKPSIAPFALIGMRDRRWWLFVVAGAASCLLCWPLFVQWVTVMANIRGTDALYSIRDFRAPVHPADRVARETPTRRIQGGALSGVI